MADELSMGDVNYENIFQTKYEIINDLSIFCANLINFESYIYQFNAVVRINKHTQFFLNIHILYFSNLSNYITAQLKFNKDIYQLYNNMKHFITYYYDIIALCENNSPSQLDGYVQQLDQIYLESNYLYDDIQYLMKLLDIQHSDPILYQCVENERILPNQAYYSINPVNHDIIRKYYQSYFYIKNRDTIDEILTTLTHQYQLKFLFPQVQINIPIGITNHKLSEGIQHYQNDFKDLLSKETTNLQLVIVEIIHPILVIIKELEQYITNLFDINPLLVQDILDEEYDIDAQFQYIAQKNQVLYSNLSTIQISFPNFALYIDTQYREIQEIQELKHICHESIIYIHLLHFLFEHTLYQQKVHDIQSSIYSKFV